MNLNEIISRLKIFLKIQDDKELAEILGVSPQDFANRYRRGTLINLILEFVLNKNVNLNWIFWGKGDMVVEKNNKQRQLVANDFKVNYLKKDFCRPIKKISGDCMIVTAAEMEFIHDLLCILKSGDEGLIEAIKTNLREFKRLSKILNPNFGDIIILDRRINNELIKFKNRRDHNNNLPS